MTTTEQPTLGRRLCVALATLLIAGTVSWFLRGNHEREQQGIDSSRRAGPKTFRENIEEMQESARRLALRQGNRQINKEWLHGLPIEKVKRRRRKLQRQFGEPANKPVANPK